MQMEALFTLLLSFRLFLPSAWGSARGTNSPGSACLGAGRVQDIRNSLVLGRSGGEADDGCGEPGGMLICADMRGGL